MLSYLAAAEPYRSIVNHDPEFARQMARQVPVAVSAFPYMEGVFGAWLGTTLAEKLLDAARQDGWTLVSMKDDWKTLFKDLRRQSIMARENRERIRQEIRSPRSAAVAGIVFSVLMFAIMIVTREMTAERASQMTGDRLELWTGAANFAIGVVPFAGIALLWFTGVVREHLGEQEDRFFSTVFFGSSIILIVMFFVWGAIMGASFNILNSAAGRSVDNDIFIFGFTFMNQIISNYALRMAGVYMFSIGTIWTKSRAMPRWLTILTYVVALSFLFFANSVREARFIFPGWVLIVSAYILLLNYRLNEQLDNQQG